jgi:phosphohistidine phosphatase
MKTLHIARHGKSTWDLPGIADIDRPLLEKGILNTYVMADLIEKKFPIPNLIISSTACRALHTATIMARALKLKTSAITLNKRIYESNTSTILDIIEDVDDEVNCLMIVGHNPTFTELANLFLTEQIDNLPTSGIVTLHFEEKKWSIMDKTPIFAEVNYPKKNND